MKKTICLALIITLFSCNKNNQNNTKPEVNHENKKISDKEYIYSTDDVQKYLNLNEETREYTINTTKESQKFNSNQLSFPVKENDFGYTKSETDVFFDIQNFMLGDGSYKIILYNSYGENDAIILNIELDSYDKNNELIDALLLDRRFSFEGEYFSSFKIRNDRTIEIKKFSIDKLLFNESGDIIGEKDKYDTIIDVVNYKINEKGLFSKYKKESKGNTADNTVNLEQYKGSFSKTVEIEATTSGIASVTYNFTINDKEVLLEKTTYLAPINCIGKYTAIEKNSILELYYAGEEENCKTKDPNFKLKKEGNKFFMKGLGGEGTFNEWIEIKKK